MDKRYQIFISSTFADLKEERKMVMQAVLELNHFPAGMELFPAIDTKQFDYIKQIIDDSDYYLLIIGARYGSIDEDGISYTEKEYDYAVSKGIPIIVFIRKDIDAVLGQYDIEVQSKKKLKEFIEKAKEGRLVKFWKDANELNTKVVSSLVNVFEKQKRIGWIRASAVNIVNSQVIENLQKEKETISTQLSEEKQKRLNIENDYKSLQQEKNKVEDELSILSVQAAESKSKQFEIEQSYQSLQQENERLKIELNDKLRNNQNNCNDSNPHPLVLTYKEMPFFRAFKSLIGSFDETEKIIRKRTEIPKVNVFYIGEVSFNMVLVRGGSFYMGTPPQDHDAQENEYPVHHVALTDFWIGDTQVTQALWQAVMNNNPCYNKGDKLPMCNISWNDCKAFIEELNSLQLIRSSNLRFRLPTEAEWEFAARGGNSGKMNGFIYAGSNEINEVAWYKGNSEMICHPVAEKVPNYLGLYDMCGNVWEWCEDSYCEYSEIDVTNPIVINDTGFHISRGGSCFNDACLCRVSSRRFDKFYKSFEDIGFRLAASVYNYNSLKSNEKDEVDT